MSFDPRTFIKNYLDDARPLGKANELSWLDFKREWHPMKTEEGKLEFVKDVAALANTGQDALLVFGVEDKTFAFKDQRIVDSGYGDASHFQSLVASRISPTFSLELGEMEYDAGKSKHTLSFIHVAPTRNRPHLVTRWAQKLRIAGVAGPLGPARTFENALFFRRGTITFGPTSDTTPTRTELDAMFFDRPGTATRLKIAVWGRKQVRFAESRDPHIEQQVAGLDLPIVFTNIGLVPTGVEHISAGGTLRFPDQPGLAPFTFPGRMSRFSFWGDRGENFEYPIPVAVGRAEYARVRVAFLRSDWSGIAAGRPVRRELVVQLRVRDIFGNEFAESLVFDGDSNS